MAFVIGAGTTATIDDAGGSSPTALSNLISIGGNSATRGKIDVTVLSDTTMASLPGRTDPGELVLTFLLDDTATATNQLTALKTRWSGGDKSVVAVNFPGSTIDTLLTWTGYITNVTTPEISGEDSSLKYSVTFMVSAAG